MNRFLKNSAQCAAAALWVVASAAGGERVQEFDRDPGWEGHNNRPAPSARRELRQDFGYSPTQNAGGARPGEVGGVITPAAEPAYYALPIDEKTFADKLSASGVISCGDGPAHVLMGFFNSGTINEWRTPNTIALRIQGRGEKFFAYVEYATSRWRAGGDEPQSFARELDRESKKETLRGFNARRARHTWSLAYDPRGNGGTGTITATVDNEKAVCNLAPGHKADGAKFNRFGILVVMKSADSPGELWLDDITVNGKRESFDADPNWQALGNRRIYATMNVRPKFDFGFSPTNFAGGKNPGELGGLVFRGDCRYADRMACYGDRVGPLTLDRPLRASGTIALHRGVSDSTTLFGFYHHERSMAVNPSQESGWPEGFLGFAVEGPSREGFLVYPAYRTRGDRQGSGTRDDRPHILPDGSTHHWSLVYDPAQNDGHGRITLEFDGRTTALDLRPGDRATAPSFDRFGLVTTWIDGNAETIYFDDLHYTASQE